MMKRKSVNYKMDREDGMGSLFWWRDELMHSWGFALSEGVFAETEEGICRNKECFGISIYPNDGLRSVVDARI